MVMFAPPRPQSKNGSRNRTGTRVAMRSVSCESKSTGVTVPTEPTTRKETRPISRCSSREPQGATPTIAFHHGGRSMPHLGDGPSRGSAGLKVTVGSVSATKKTLMNNCLSNKSADSDIDMSPQRTEQINTNRKEVPISAPRTNDTAVLIFDWDDTLLPTTFCEGLPPIPNSGAVRSSHL